MPKQSDKQQVAVRIPLRRKAELEREANEIGASRSEYIRSILEDRHRTGELVNRLETREDRIDQLEEQLARRSQVEEKVDVLAKRVESHDKPDPPFFIRWVEWWRSRGNPADDDRGLDDVTKPEDT